MSISKKIKFIALLSVCPATGFADKGVGIQGLSGGVSLGASFWSLTRNEKVGKDSGTDVPIFEGISSRKTGFAGYGVFGYGDFFADSDFFWGASLWLGYASGTNKQEKEIAGSYHVVSSVKRSFTVKGLFKVGKAFESVAPYALFGFYGQSCKLDHETKDLVDDKVYGETSNYFLPGIAAGVGATIPLTEKMFLDVSYQFNYGFSHTEKYALKDGSISIEGKKNYAHAVLLGAGWSFGGGGKG